MLFATFARQTDLALAFGKAGAIFGGIAWGLSGGAAGVAEAVIRPAVGGDYVVTPAHLRRERKLAFVAPAGGGRGPHRGSDYYGGGI